jgi:tRNA(fMet)-specific endonuclease VapC
MARYLLDTNILAYSILAEIDNISKDTQDILNDYNNQLFTSSICVMELLQLYKIKKIQAKKYKNATELYQALEHDFFIKILPFTEKHINILAKLKIADGHNDPFDHSIISTAIAETLILVSSDRQFEKYTKQKLLFAFNKR